MASCYPGITAPTAARGAGGCRGEEESGGTLVSVRAGEVPSVETVPRFVGKHDQSKAAAVHAMNLLSHKA